MCEYYYTEPTDAVNILCFVCSEKYESSCDADECGNLIKMWRYANTYQYIDRQEKKLCKTMNASVYIVLFSFKIICKPDDFDLLNSMCLCIDDLQTYHMRCIVHAYA